MNEIEQTLPVTPEPVAVSTTVAAAPEIVFEPQTSSMLDDVEMEEAIQEPISQIVDQVLDTDKPVDAATEKPAEPAVNPVVYKMTNPHVVMKVDPVGVLPEKDDRPPVPYVASNIDEIGQLVESPYFKNNSANFDEAFNQVLAGSFDIAHNSGLMGEALERDDSEWVQNVNHETNDIAAYAPKWKANHNEALTGAKALAKFQRAVKHGSFLTFPCWASGVWVTLKAPNQYELADYQDQVSNEIIELGKQTNGAIFGNNQVYLNKYLIDLAEKLLYETSVSDSGDNKKTLSELLVVEDLETIAWALGVILYPNGYPFEEACIANIEKCNWHYKQLINIAKIYWVDKNRLTDWQINFMRDSKLKRSMGDIEKYRSESSWLKLGEVKFDEFKIMIRIPTVEEHITAGYTWIDEVESSIRKIIDNPNDRKLNDLVYERAALTILRTYGHYISSIQFNDSTRILARESIDEVINELCSEPEMVKTITEKLEEYIKKNTISMVAIPRHSCPNCGEDLNPQDKTHPFLVPISALKLFFALRDRKLLFI